MKNNIFNVFLKYMQTKIISMITIALFAVIFAFVFALYHLEVEAILYASALCILLAVFINVVGFIKYYRKHMILTEISNNINILSSNLEESTNLIENDYIEIVTHLSGINNEAVTNLKTQRADSIDYYTTWVHQIKTPIAAMRLILQSEDTDEHKELLSELFRIEQYVDMVLTYFRLDSSSNDFVFGHYNLDKIIKQSVRKYAPSFVRKRIGLIYEGTDISVLTDEKWLGFITEQLLSNAIKYTDKGNVTITAQDNILCISDTGIGIAQEDLPRIFEKGYSGYNGRANKKSTGLGLFLCKQACNKLSHKIYVESQVAKGTSVFVDLSQIDLEVE